MRQFCAFYDFELSANAAKPGSSENLTQISSSKPAYCIVNLEVAVLLKQFCLANWLTEQA